MNEIPIVDINKVILHENFFISSNSENEIDIEKTSNKLKLLLSEKEYGDAIIVGHLAPYVIDSSIGRFCSNSKKNPF